MKGIIYVLLVIIITISCERNRLDPFQEDPEESFINGDGVFIVNEGNYTWGNGSISFYSYDSSKMFNDVFLRVNERPLGDVPNSMTIYNEYAYLVVNNSGKIEVVKKNSFESVTTIPGLISPRNIAVINDLKAYVTSLYSDSVRILDLKKNTVSGYINIRRASEAIVVSGNKAFVSCWYGGNEVMVINTDNDEVIDSVKVGQEPESMVVDRKYRLWVLCTGGWARENYAELIGLSTQTHEIIKTFTFPSKLDSPSGLTINGTADTLFYIEKGVRRMDIDALALPPESWIENRGRFFYKIAVNPVNGDVFVTDAVDYQQKGFVYIYDSKGDSLAAYRAGIIPGSMCFKVQPSAVIE